MKFAYALNHPHDENEQARLGSFGWDDLVLFIRDSGTDDQCEDQAASLFEISRPLPDLWLESFSFRNLNGENEGRLYPNIHCRDGVFGVWNELHSVFKNRWVWRRITGVVLLCEFSFLWWFRWLGFLITILERTLMLRMTRTFLPFFSEWAPFIQFYHHKEQVSVFGRITMTFIGVTGIVVLSLCVVLKFLGSLLPTSFLLSCRFSSCRCSCHCSCLC